MFAKDPIEPNAIYTREETARLLGISLSTLKHLIHSGQLRVSQPAGLRRVFIRGTSILEMLEMSERGGTLPSTTQSKLEHLDSLDSGSKSLRSKQIPARTSAARRAAHPAGGADH